MATKSFRSIQSVTLTFTSLWANSAEDKLMIFFLFFPEYRIQHFMKLSPMASDLHEFAFLGKSEKNMLKTLPRVQSSNLDFICVLLYFHFTLITFKFCVAVCVFLSPYFKENVETL